MLKLKPPTLVSIRDYPQILSHIPYLLNTLGSGSVFSRVHFVDLFLNFNRKGFTSATINCNRLYSTLKVWKEFLITNKTLTHFLRSFN